MSTPKIKAVTPPEGKRLLVTFVNGVQKVYDCQGILQLDRFQLLRNEAFFKAVTVDPGGVWSVLERSNGLKRIRVMAQRC